MASVTATATMAAAGFNKRSSTYSSSSSLQTPGSGTFPSEMVSPMACSPGFLKKDDLKTPITPPSAYLDFLKQMSPAMLSPAPTSTSARFSFNERKSETVSETGSEKPSVSPPTSQPPLSRNTSYDSNASINTQSSTQSTASHASSHASTAKRRPESPRVTIPPSPFAKPALRSARGTGAAPRLHIPQSPFTPALGSAHSLQSPYSSTPVSAAPWSASFSPREWPTEVTGKPGKVSVRQVVTRTVTYCSTPLEPAPKGKRRKIEVEEVDSKSASEEPPIKQEKLDEEQETTPSVPEPPKDA